MHILIIDNDVSIRKALKMGLTRAGWFIDDVSADFVCVAELMDGQSYDIIVVDLDLEDLTILNSIKKEKKQDHTMIVVGMTRNGVADALSDIDMGYVNSCYQIPMHLNMLKRAIDLELKKR